MILLVGSLNDGVTLSGEFEDVDATFSGEFEDVLFFRPVVFL